MPRITGVVCTNSLWSSRGCYGVRVGDFVRLGVSVLVGVLVDDGVNVCERVSVNDGVNETAGRAVAVRET